MPLTEEQLKMLEGSKGGLTEAQQKMLAAPADTQKIRSLGQGLLFGWADELEAGVRSMMSDRSYKEIRDEIRSKIKQYQQENPGEAITYELLGAAAPTALSFLVPGGGAVTTGATASRVGGIGARQLMKRGATEGFVAGAGASEEETASGVIGSGLGGAATGAVVSPVAGKTLEAATGKLAQIANLLREKIGERPSDMAISQLQQLATGTGKSIDEIIDDIANGRILAENRTLAAAVRAIKSKGADAGEAPSMIESGLRGRAKTTAEQARDVVSKELMPESSGANVAKAFEASDEALRRLERRGFRSVFSTHKELDSEATSILDEVSKRFPMVRNELGGYYKETGIVPLYKIDDAGAVSLNRVPSLEDAEVAYRLLRDEASKRYSAGSGTSANVVRDAAKQLKNALDAKYPDLKNVRALSAQRFSTKEAFAEGKKAFGMDADDVEFAFEKMSPQQKAAFKGGVLQAFRNKMRRSPTAVGRAADLDRQEGAILKIVAGENYEKVLQQPLAIAGESQEAANKILYGSMTAPESAASKALGSGKVSMQELMSAFGGNPMAIAAIVGKRLEQAMPQLSARDYEKVTEVLLSTDPEFVRKMLTDQVSLGNIMQKISPIVRAVESGATRSATYGSSAAVGEETGPISSGLLERLTIE